MPLGSRGPGELSFRAPTEADEEALRNVRDGVEKTMGRWESKGLIPKEPRREGRADWSCEIYGLKRWCHTFSPSATALYGQPVEELIRKYSEIDKLRMQAQD